jgi:hypothetical protein
MRCAFPCPWPADGDPAAGIELSPYFALLAEIARRHDVKGLSIGMLEISAAVMLGATAVRVGTVLLGPMTSVDAIIFDFDGVLVESEYYGNSAARRAVDRPGHPTSTEEDRRVRRLQRRAPSPRSSNGLGIAARISGTPERQPSVLRAARAGRGGRIRALASARSSQSYRPSSTPRWICPHLDHWASPTRSAIICTAVAAMSSAASRPLTFILRGRLSRRGYHQPRDHRGSGGRGDGALASGATSLALPPDRIASTAMGVLRSSSSMSRTASTRFVACSI